VIAVDEYCRAVEAHLCRRNEGHLIRVVGPAFDVVRGWAEHGIPLSIVEAGIDRYVERQAAKGPRRRPIRVEFCEADVLDAFDAWRRAVGVPEVSSPGPRRTRGGATPAETVIAGGQAEPSGEDAPGSDIGGAAGRRRVSLAAHVERGLARLTAMRGSGPEHAGLGDALAAAVRGLDLLLAEARGARGDAREAVIARLARLDDDLGRAVVRALGDDELAALRAESGRELAPFRGRMDEAAFARALDAAVERSARQRRGLPRLAFD
jgi:hypothetical protein